MYTIFSAAYMVLVLAMLFTIIRSVFSDSDLETEQVYVNLDSNTSKPFKFFLWALWTEAGLFVLGFVFPPLWLVMFIPSIVTKVLAWVWLYETYQKGIVNVWIADIKNSFESKK